MDRSRVDDLATAARRWLRRTAGEMAHRRPGAGSRRVILGAAAVLFVAATAVAASNLPPVELDARWLVPVGFLAGMMASLNAAEYWLAARWVGVHVSPRSAFSVTVLATAANLAPIPGAVLVRGHALLSEGGEAAEAGRALATIGLAWVGVALCVAAASLAGVGRAAAGSFVALAGVGALAIVLPLRPERLSPRGLVGCLTLELAAVIVQGLRLSLVFLALGLEGRFVRALALPAAGAVASAAGVVPGGLGLRELLAGGIAPLVGIPAAEGVTATAVDRIVGLLILGGLAGIAVSLRSRSGADRSGGGRE